eukprot:TRINITY_DN1424_c0_g3_i1.p1 TRINITY_DN1424_c0_g3~~TRINITY_DN1424_c0_g3_i1.p1  ORF type:complete len:702 (+),score=255.18 TRINITY_DN1424_c0_g3_i1:55-2106(+)
MGSSASGEARPGAVVACEFLPENWVTVVVQYMTLPDAVSARLVSKGVASLLRGEEGWRLLAGCAARTAGLYCPVDSLLSYSSWRDACLQSWESRHLWLPQAAAQQAASNRFSLQVSVRFRPQKPGEPQREGTSAVMPLHQRVRIARAANKTATVGTTMRSVLGQRLHKTKGLDMLYQSCHRLRPFPSLRALRSLQREAAAPPAFAGLAAAEQCRVVSVAAEQGRVVVMAPGAGLRDFGFPCVLDRHSEQGQVYEQAARRVVVDFVNGYNGTIMTYGQTGSGKTFTMFGPDKESAKKAVHDGVAQRAMAEVCSAMAERQKDVDCRLSMSYVEVYGNEVSDLLRGGVLGQNRDGRFAGVRATDRVGHRYVLDGDTEQEVESLEHLLHLLTRGDEMKRRAATAMNARSTRAHSVVVLSLFQKHRHTGVEVRSRLFLADLGGSEKLSRSKVHQDLKAPVAFREEDEDGDMVLNWDKYYQSRERVQETLHINRGLYALKRCIAALREDAKRKSADDPSIYVPYQDSKLTLLLSEGLGGSSKTALIATAASDICDGAETLQTLRFAEGCMDVRLGAGVSAMTIAAAAIAEVDAEIAAVEEQIKRKERWVESETVRQHVVSLKPQSITADGSYVDDTAGSYLRREAVVDAGPAEAVEHPVLGMRLVGAEAEREVLERLLARRQAIVAGDV